MHLLPRSARLPLALLFLPATLWAEVCEVQSEDITGLDTAIADGCSHIYVLPGMNGMRHFTLPAPSGSGDYRYTIDSDVEIMASDGESLVEFFPQVGFERSFGFGRISAQASFRGGNLGFRDFGSDSDGGTIRVDNGQLILDEGFFIGSWSAGFGGAVASFGDSEVTLSRLYWDGNRAEFGGGHVGFYGSSTGILFGNNFFDGEVGEFAFGHALDVNTNGVNRYGVAVKSLGNQYLSRQDINFGDFRGRFLSLIDTIEYKTDAFNAVAPVQKGGVALIRGLNFTPQKSRGGPWDAGPEAACNDFGTNAFTSLGYNIAPDASCNLTMPTDQPNTDAMMTLAEDGWIEPMPGSPAIDAAVADVLIEPGNPLALAPCPTIDGRGTARPQDGDGDGNFECDIGAIEFPGAGNIVAGHSGAYYNVNRSGEGNYVEILSPDLAVIYTFTYRPDGSGPAWFVALAGIKDNAIISLEVLRPTGTSWGSGFDAGAITRDPAGAMNMVFPTCAVAGNSGNTVYTGNPDIGYEGLVSRTSRISRVLGCNFTPAPRVGLSGSFYDPNRSGEGLIIQWLDDGRVLVIMFTFDPNGNQMWLTGTGTPNGNTVTIDVVYPAASTGWGRNFDPDEIDLQSWGTFTLTWTACNDLTFAWNSTVSGYGSGTHAYRRLTSLAGTNCPGF